MKILYPILPQKPICELATYAIWTRTWGNPGPSRNFSPFRTFLLAPRKPGNINGRLVILLDFLRLFFLLGDFDGDFDYSALEDWDDFEDDLGTILVNYFGDNFRDNFRDSFEDNLWNNFRDSFRDNFENSFITVIVRN